MRPTRFRDKKMKKQQFIIGLLICLGLIFIVSCKKNGICDVEDPLTDLPWLKEIINDVESNTEAGFRHHVRIFQCTYKDGTGFRLEMCVGCPDAGYSFRNCQGDVLCGGGGHDGQDNCAEFKIKDTQKLIYEQKP